MPNIPDTTISNLNAIVQGFVPTDCLQLRISSTNTISTLGLLTGFSSDQVCTISFKLNKSILFFLKFNKIISNKA